MNTSNFSEFHSNFILRTPVLPFGLDFTEEDLLQAFEKELVKESIYLASPVLYSEIIKVKESVITEKKERQKVILSFAKYYTRMRTRCTPYGLFAGCSVGKFDSTSNAKILSIETLNKSIRRHTRPDMNYLCAFAQELSTNELIRYRLTFFPNRSLYKIGNQIRYVEYKYHNGARIHQIASVEHSEYLDRVLLCAREGKNLADLSSFLVDDEITLEEATFYINELVNSQLLVSELEANVTGPEYIEQLINTLSKIESETIDNGALSYLKHLKSSLKVFDENKSNNVAHYRCLFEKTKEFNVRAEENQLFQVDLFKDSESNVLDNSIKTQLSDVIRFMDKFSFIKDNSVLNKFKERFLEKYGDSEVPLLVALDTETGVGYKANDTSGSSELIDDLKFNIQSNKEMSFVWTQQQEIIFQKYLDAIKNNKEVINLTDDDFKNIPQKEFQAPYTMSVMFRVLNKNGKLQVKNCGGSSAGNLLGRFAHGNKEIQSIVSEICEYEKKQIPDKIIAEISHLPESRLGNILQRPIFREFEIPYLANSVLEMSNQILPENMVVSIKNGQVVLRDKILDKEIVPRLTNAHNYSQNALPVYHFLADLQTQHFQKSGFGFDWGVLGYSAKFLPRIEYKGTVISPAMWRLQRNDFQSLLDMSSVSDSAIFKWQQEHNIPDTVVLMESDNELTVNFKNIISVNMFISCLKRKNQITLSEFCFDENNYFVKDENKKGYTNEFIAIIFSPNSTPALEKVIKNTGIHTVQEKFYPGEEWIYLKIYCGIKVADFILLNAIKPLMEELKHKGLIDNWFFIRYSDPNWHIRLRVHMTKLDNLNTVMYLLTTRLNEFIRNGIVQKVQQDVYVRELERYGFDKIVLAESFFQIDSECVLNFLELIDGENGERLRWQFSIRCIDDLLSIFQYSLEEKMKLMESIKTGYFNEHGGNKDLKIQLDTKYRKLKMKVDFILDPNNLRSVELEPLQSVLEKRNTNLETLFKELASTRKINSVFIDGLLTSYIHMMLNRLFFSRQRTFELVIYDLLNRHYKSLLARTVKNKVSGEISLLS